jgi:hypothetical protein
VTIQLKPEHELVVDRAIKAGLIESPEEVLDVGIETIRSRLETQVSPGASMGVEQWLREFRSWVHSHPTTTPLLSDEAMSRESIYGTRGL